MILESLGLIPTPKAKKVTTVPDTDTFAKKRKMKEDKSEIEISEASASISNAMKAVTTMIATRGQTEPVDHTALFLTGLLKKIAPQNKLKCVREMLAIIEKYQ